MAVGAKRFWADLTAEDFRQLDAARVVAVLPVGAVEQHGPHLPVSVDRDLVDALVQRAVPLLPPDLPVLFLPTVAVGKSNEHIAFAGTLTVSTETLLRLWLEIGASVARAGVRRLVLFNGHGGNIPVMDIAARELRQRHGMLAVACSWFLLGAQDDLFPAQELRHGIHAGDLETSMMLAIRPELVAMDRATNFRSAAETWERELTLVGLGGRGARPGWLAQDLNPQGACGDAGAATAEKGEAVLGRAAERLVTVLREVQGLAVDHLRPA